MITIAFLSKIYLISPLRAFSLWLVSSISTGIIILIIFAVIGFNFLFSLFNALQNQNSVNDTNTTQQVYPTQDQTQQDTTSLINVITPAVGETYNPGQIITVVWTPGTPGITYINFVKSDNTFSTMAAPQSTPDVSGSMQYTFPKEMPAGQYKIYAFYKNENNIDIKAYESDGFFNIISSTSKTVPAATNTIKSDVNKIFTAFIQGLAKSNNFDEMMVVMNRYKSKKSLSDLNLDISATNFTQSDKELMFSLYKRIGEHFYAIAKTEIVGSSATVEALVCEEVGCSKPEKFEPGMGIKANLILENGVWKINS